MIFFFFFDKYRKLTIVWPRFSLRRSVCAAAAYCSSSPTFISFSLSLLPYSLISHSPSHPSSPSSSVPFLPLSLSISIVTFISLTLCLFYFSLKDYIHDADKCNGPLAGSLQLRLGRRFSHCINPSSFFFTPHHALPFMQLEDANSQGNGHRPVGLCNFE